MDCVICTAYLDAINYVHFTFLPKMRNVSGPKPAVWCDGLLCGFRIILVAVHDRWALDQHFSSCLGSHYVIAFMVDDPT